MSQLQGGSVVAEAWRRLASRPRAQPPHARRVAFQAELSGTPPTDTCAAGQPDTSQGRLLALRNLGSIRDQWCQRTENNCKQQGRHWW